MSNTPTESEFDKEMKLMIDEIGHAGANGDNRKETQTIYLKAIKQAVDKHVIGDPINVHSRSNLYASKPGTEGLEQKWYDLGTNGRVEEQRKALYGGDKK